MVTPKAVRLAAIDIGTNSVRLVVAEVDPDGTYRVLDEEREMVRLGHGLFQTGRLGAGTTERGLEVLSKMKAIADGFEVTELRAVATSAVREAANGRAFVREARRRCGLRIDVIPPEEEAQLVLQSALRHFDLSGRAVAVVDIGGGSMEVVLVAGTVVDQVHVLPLGAVRLAETYGRSDPLRGRHWRKLKRAIDRVLEQRIGKPPFHPEAIIGSGGTFTNLAEMVQAEREGNAGNVQGYAVTRADVAELVQRLRATPLDARRQIPGLNPRRADIIVAGAAAVARLAKHLDTQQILVNERGLRDGVLLTMIGDRFDSGAATPARPADRLEWVRAFARTCRSNERHCQHVAALADQLFDALRDVLDLPEEGRGLLTAAALLHDVGYVINHSKHHKHAYHLILHGDLRGYTPREVDVVANVARYHRRAFPKKSHANFARLEKADRRLVRRLAAILRVADGLDRTHTRRVTAVACEPRRGGVRVLVTAASDPRVEIWDAERKASLLQRVLDGSLEFRWTRAEQRRRPSRAVDRPRLALAGG
jgi:exopolyphosphatase/guanosine-5'-triphosphate,3'-diphosphate pyrophosphatase